MHSIEIACKKNTVYKFLIFKTKRKFSFLHACDCFPLPLLKPSCTHALSWRCPCFFFSLLSQPRPPVPCSLSSPNVSDTGACPPKTVRSVFTRSLEHTWARSKFGGKKQFLECFKGASVSGRGRLRDVSVELTAQLLTEVELWLAVAILNDVLWKKNKTSNHIQCCHSLVSSKSFLFFLYYPRRFVISS